MTYEVSSLVEFHLPRRSFETFQAWICYPVRIGIISGRELGPDLAATWVGLQRANVDLSSAFFHPEFTRCVSRVKPNVEIAIVEDAGTIVAFFPFERILRSRGEPVGGLLSDYHGVVSASGVDADFAGLDLLRACRLTAWDFSRLPASQSCFHAQTHSLIASPQIELADGYAAYAEHKRASGSSLIDRATYSARRLIPKALLPDSWGIPPTQFC